MTTTNVLIQARTGSTRLPGKILKELCGKPIASWIFERLSKCKSVQKVIFCIPETENDRILENFLLAQSIPFHKGSENDVLGRFYETSLHYPSDNIVRVCADNPFVSFIEIDRLVQFFNQENIDFAFNHIPKDNNQYPDGFGAEIFSTKTLHNISSLATIPGHREHLTSYIYDNPEKFKIKTFQAPKEIADPNVKLDVDTVEDFKKLEVLTELLLKQYGPSFTDQQIVQAYWEIHDN